MLLVPIILPQFAGGKRVMKCQPLVDWWLHAGNQPDNYHQLHPRAWRKLPKQNKTWKRDSKVPTVQLPPFLSQSWFSGKMALLHFHDGRKSSQKFNRPKMAILKRILTFSKLIIIFSSHVVFSFRGWKTFPQAWQPPQPPGNPQSHSLPRCVDSSYPKFPSRIVKDRRGGR